MSNKPDGGPAFACASENGHQPGMPLRDWFAGQCLVRLAVIAADGPPGFAEQTYAERAKAAYEQADAMIAARSK